MAMQKQRGIKTGDPFEPKNAEDNMKKGGKVMEKEYKSEMHKEEKADKKQDVKLIKKAFKEHDAQEHPGKHTKLALKKGGKVHKMAKGGVTGKEMKAVGRNVARAMNQKSSSRGR